MRTKPTPHQRPEPFPRIHLDFTKAVAIFISSELAPSMVDTLMLVSPDMQAGINAIRAQLRVRGLGQDEQGLKASIDPGEPEVQEMVETVLAPTHPDPFEALLDEPFARTLHH